MSERRITNHEVTQIVRGHEGGITVRMDRNIERTGMQITNDFGSIVLTPSDLDLIQEAVDAFSIAESALFRGVVGEAATPVASDVVVPFPFRSGKDTDGSAA